MTNASAEAAKATMRMHVRNLRRTFVREHPEADWQAGEHCTAMIEDLAGGKAPGVVAVYKSSGAEIDTRPLTDCLIARGWSLALPACEALDEPVVFRNWKPGDKLNHDICGIAAPLVSAGEVDPAIIITPLITFDRQGGRLGQGGGYYDRTMDLLRLKVRPPAFVGLAFSIQEVDHVPQEAHDQRLDAILTEKEYIAVRKDV